MEGREGGWRTWQKSLWHSFNVSPLIQASKPPTTTTLLPIHPLHSIFLGLLFFVCLLGEFTSLLSNVHFCLVHSFLFHHTLSFSVTPSALVRSPWRPLSKPPISSSFPPILLADAQEEKFHNLDADRHTQAYGVRANALTHQPHRPPLPPPPPPTPPRPPPPQPSTLFKPLPPTLILITPPPPSSALISLHQICSDSKQFPLICDFYGPPPASYTFINPPTPFQ